MNDAFDSGFEEQPQHTQRVYDPVPTGQCRVEIVKAERKTLPWKVSDSNPNGDCLSLRLTASSAHGFVFVDLPADKQWLLEHVARAVGIAADQCVPEVLVGRHASVVIDHITKRDGGTRAVVKKWISTSGAPQADKQRPDGVKRSRNAVKRYGADDDIPF